MTKEDIKGRAKSSSSKEGVTEDLSVSPPPPKVHSNVDGVVDLGGGRISASTSSLNDRDAKLAAFLASLPEGYR